ncbi:hypothetical protein [Mycobacterium persicum]|uniref:hypothetical protein n=1 Tax=Mycobacterium persicum TaxID=1487726 RepID=UPI0013C34F2A|nr:hypothetical protein [Mycobacterium persicum]
MTEQPTPEDRICTGTCPCCCPSEQDLQDRADEQDRVEILHLMATQFDCDCPMCRAYAGAPNDVRPC